MHDVCQCEECVARRVGELLEYACALEKGVIKARELLHENQFAMAFNLIEAVADMGVARDLAAEVRELEEVYNLRMAADLREAGRLN